MAKLERRGGFVKPLLIIGVISSVLAGCLLYGLFAVRPIRTLSVSKQTETKETPNLTKEVNIAAGVSGIEMLEGAGLRASANIDWSMLYGNREVERSQVSAAIIEASSKYGVNADLLRAIIMTESVFDDKAVSQKGARGLMQLMPGTATQVGVSNLEDSRENILGGAAYFSDLLDEFNGDIRLSLAAYNAGPRTIREANLQIPVDILPYVNRVMSYYKLFSGEALPKQN